MSYTLYANDGGTPVLLSSGSAPEYVERIEALEVSQLTQDTQIATNTTNAAQAASDAATAAESAATALTEVRNITVMTGATTLAAGTSGLTPVPAAGSSDRFLCSDGTWETVQSSSYSLFDYKWADHILNDVRWLRADTFSWHSGAVYSDCYTELYDEYNNNASVSESNGLFNYMRTPKGYCITTAANASLVDDMYESQGIAWYYILDTVNTQFKLPRTKYGFVGMRTAPGTQVTSTTYDDNAILLSSGSAPGVNPICVQNPATQMYLYAYVGYFSKESIAQTASLNSGLFTMKADTDLANLTTAGKEVAANASMPSSRIVYLTPGASGAQYTSPATGWWRVDAPWSTDTPNYCQISLEGKGLTISANANASSSGCAALPVKAQDVVTVSYNTTPSVFLFVYAEGAE